MNFNEEPKQVILPGGDLLRLRRKSRSQQCSFLAGLRRSGTQTPVGRLPPIRGLTVGTLSFGNQCGLGGRAVLGLAGPAQSGGAEGGKTAAGSFTQK